MSPYCEIVRTRYAPTPSGYLHLGNAANFMTTHLLARRYGADLVLRIDDVDTRRVRPEYVDDVFDLLDWLDLHWDSGPKSAVDMDAWSQLTRVADYRKALMYLVDTGQAYACSCSRAQWTTYRGDGCPGSCRNSDVEFETGTTAWRLHYRGGPDPVLWRRDDVPAYHLTSVVDDDLWAVDLIVRGADLLETTRLQRYLSSLLPGSKFHAVTVVHHSLVTDNDGRKLSKSAGAGRSTLPRTDENREHITLLAEACVAEVSRDLPRSFGS